MICRVPGAPKYTNDGIIIIIPWLNVPGVPGAMLVPAAPPGPPGVCVQHYLSSSVDVIPVNCRIARTSTSTPIVCNAVAGFTPGLVLGFPDKLHNSYVRSNSMENSTV